MITFKSVCRMSGSAAALMAGLLGAASAQQPSSVALVGSLQSELGCPGDWQPDCPATELFFDGSVWIRSFDVPAGAYEFKVALNDSWAENYGAGGAPNGANIPMSLATMTTVTFIYDHATTTISSDAPIPEPAAVTIAGSLQSELGCPGDWQADCAATHLTFDPDDGVWQETFSVPAGDWEYKAPLNDSWAENYGAGGVRDGANIGLSLASAQDVKFYFSNATKWVTDNVNSRIVTAAGSFQSELGCPGEWQPWCLQSWLQDPDGDGFFTFATRKIPAGNYEVKAAVSEGWSENYGAGGVPNGANIGFSVANDGDQVVFTFNSATNELDVGGDLPKGDLSTARAYWLAEDVIAWDVPQESTVRIHHADQGGLTITKTGVQGGTAITLSPVGTVSGAEAQKFRHLTGLPTYQIPGADRAMIDDILRGQLVLSATDTAGAPIDATAIQFPGVLDDLYANDEDMGVVWNGVTPTIRLWAPTAHNVKLHLFDSSDQSQGPSQVLPMVRDDATGNWSVVGAPGWNRKYYLFEVEVFVRSTGQVETNLVTDPYSLSLSMDSLRSQIVNMDDGSLKPRKWDKLKKPAFAAPEDAVVYELHVRDFSMSDPEVKGVRKGTFMAFDRPAGRGLRHLRNLARSGLTHVHLLPAFDCATIPEDKSAWKTPGDLSIYPPDSDQQQAAIAQIRDEDGFNWCYDPFHYTVPEGSYSTEPDGPARIREFRTMVSGLNRLGLRTVMDVVYNHTSGSGQGDKSVLDKVVPDYYHRLNADGFIETSSCCANTATEHAMMEKLMLDSLEVWARDYKVDGFRFDLMGHHTKENIEKARDRLQALTLEEDGVDGSSIYLYGEGWNFGEVGNDARFTQATQRNMGDNTGVGSFNDRIRDAVRGGGPFDTGIDHVRRQGFANGLFLDPNFVNSGSQGEKDELLAQKDWIRLSLAGALEDYTFENQFGDVVPASQINYFGNPGAGYTSDPQEVINYVAAHDNETLYDINAYKLPRSATPLDRVRAQVFATAMVMFAQGVPFIHAGQEISRSKSMDRNSYNSGDWFNHLGYDYTDNGWGRGLPPAGDNQANWPEQAALLADPSLALDEDLIKMNAEMFRELLRIRKSHPLFRMQTADEVKQKLHFYNTGPNQNPALIVMGLGDDPAAPEVVVVFNGAPDAQTFAMAGKFELHPEQKSSIDRVVRRAEHDGHGFEVPGRTAAVFLGNPSNGK
ncbi:pullulanase-type alpha-1,6-glucosidase [Parvularcula lutaonensis]|uniref:Pullulanase-type alpha-1,6-glucosidase n=1 Tax=Parvularcula lutaonensis TaxID=491923 RepID=A0ABV7ME27_9PROT|nr:pullulanase-type alpha-1,6-glucosidase [Parvularcula lutaonensis]GGY48965.1 alpha-1,6-glucosidase [Parvularcula lutaonensis]